MLAPNYDDAVARLTDAFAGTTALTTFAQTTSNIAILNLSTEPTWLGPVKTEVALLQKLCTGWLTDAPGVLAPILVAVLDYGPQVQALAKQAGPNPDALTPEQWIALLGTLQTVIADSLSKTTAARDLMNGHLNAIGAQLPAIDAAIQAGWDALGDEEEAMTKVATAMGTFIGKVQDLGADISSAEIDGGRDYLANNVDYIYSGIAEGGAEVSIPVVGLAIAIFSIGKTFYDMIKDDDELIEDMDQINDLQAELSEDALQVTLTKSTLQTLYTLQEQFLETHDAIPELIDMWQAQSDRVDDAIDAIQAGADPALYLDIKTLAAAATIWGQLTDYGQKLANFQAHNGPPVTIDIGLKTITAQTAVS